MTDYIGMQMRFWDAIWSKAHEDIEKVLQEAWQDGYAHGLADGYDKYREGNDEVTQGKAR